MAAVERARICLTLATVLRCVVVYNDYIPTRAEEIAWAAGLFDGGGTVTLCGDCVHVRLRNTDFELVERFRDAVRIGGLYGPYARSERDGHRRKPFWDWIAREEDGFDALALMWSWLSERRKKQAHDVTGIDFTCFVEAARQLRASEAASAPFPATEGLA
jgi:hypothetical protein